MIRTVQETGSTNDDVAALAREGAAEGLWLRAERQSSGRGRQGRTWLSPPGNLYASTIVQLRVDDPPAPTLALVAAVALHQVLVTHVPTVRIKWPNDLLVDGAKLAGILLEREGDAVIAGFGVNLAHHPEGLTQPTTSLAVLTTSLPAAESILTRLVDAFAHRLAAWRSEGIGPLRAAWLAGAHPLGTPLAAAGERGWFDGLDNAGALRLRLACGDVRIVHAGDVFLL